MNEQPDRNKCQFVTDVALCNFPTVLPGQAQTSRDNNTTKIYGIELYLPEIKGSLLDAMTYVAGFYDKARSPMIHVANKIKKLEEMPTRDPAKYPYAQGMYVVNIRKNVSLKMLKMDGANLNDPATRALYETRVNEQAPNVVRLANLEDPGDLARIDQVNQQRALLKLQPLTPTNGRLWLPCTAQEIWGGCKVRVAGRVFWEGQYKKTIALALEQVMLVAQGDKLQAGEANPEDLFGGFAPAEALAPDPLAAFM